MRRLLLIAILSAVSFAHLDTGIDREVGPYLLDVGWEPDPLEAGEPVFFAINVVEQNTFEKTNFSEAWVRFSKGDRIAYAGSFHMKEGSTSFTYEFPEGGTWDLDIRFGNYSEKVELEVAPAKGLDSGFLGWLAAGFFAIVAFGMLIWKRNRK